jgi:sulfofructose kinase
MFDVVGVGANSLDEVLVTSSDLLAAVSSGKAPVEARHVFCGGQTATAMCACAMFGLKTSYIGVFGSDENARIVRRALDDRNVDTSHSIAAKGPNRSAVIVLDAAGRRTILWHRSELLKFDPQQVPSGAADARILHVDDDDAGLALAASRMARERGVPVTSDIEHLTERTEALISAVTYPILEQRLPARLTGEDDPERALRKLRSLNPNVLCMTLGEEGAAALDGDRFHVAPAFKVKTVDNTGAGDVFRAGFIYGLLQGWEVPRILRFANAAAAVSCGRLGAIPSAPKLDEVMRMCD